MLKTTTLTLCAGLALSGCISADTFLPEDARNAQREIRIQGMKHLSCRELLQRYTGANVPLAKLNSLHGPRLIQTLDDMKELMRRKGCSNVPS